MTEYTQQNNSIPKKVGLFVIDSLRYDCVGYQNKKNFNHDKALQNLETPTLDEISRESICFTKCYSTSSATASVVTSMLTGTTQVNHQMWNNKIPIQMKLNEKIITMGEIMKKLGYITVHAGDDSPWFRAHKIFRGFDYDLTKNDAKLFEFLEKHKNEKVFLYAIFEDVHAPYLWSFCPPNDSYNDDYFDTMTPLLEKYNLPIPSKPYEYWHSVAVVNCSRKLWLPIYVKGVTKFDKGRFRLFVNGLKNTGFLEPQKSMLVITSDHGEGKHDRERPDSFNHNRDAYDEVGRVPLIVRLPQLKHEINDDLVSNMDIFRIIMDVCTSNKTKDFVSHKLHCINPFYEKREFVEHIVTPVFFNGPTAYHITDRTIITKNKKYVLRGKPENFLNPKVFELNDEDFVQKLYLDLLAREPSKKEIQFYKGRIGLKLKITSKKKLLQHFLNSNEYKSGKNWFVLNLQSDPLEENPLNPFTDPTLTEDFLRYFDEMIRMERPDDEIVSSFDIVLDEKTESEKQEEKEVLEELKKLGYI